MNQMWPITARKLGYQDRYVKKKRQFTLKSMKERLKVLDKQISQLEKSWKDLQKMGMFDLKQEV